MTFVILTPQLQSILPGAGGSEHGGASFGRPSAWAFQAPLFCRSCHATSLVRAVGRAQGGGGLVTLGRFFACATAPCLFVLVVLLLLLCLFCLFDQF